MIILPQPLKCWDYNQAPPHSDDSESLERRNEVRKRMMPHASGEIGRDQITTMVEFLWSS
jgi:hypothetical protein